MKNASELYVGLQRGFLSAFQKINEISQAKEQAIEKLRAKAVKENDAAVSIAVLESMVEAPTKSQAYDVLLKQLEGLMSDTPIKKATRGRKPKAAAADTEAPKKATRRGRKPKAAAADTEAPKKSTRGRKPKAKTAEAEKPDPLA